MAPQRIIDATGQRASIEGRPLREGSKVGIQKDGRTVIEIGDKYLAIGGPEDACELKAETREGCPGIAASAQTHLPGLPVTTANEFIDAEQAGESR